MLYADVVTDLDPGLCHLLRQEHPDRRQQHLGAELHPHQHPHPRPPFLQTVDSTTTDAARVQASKAADRILADQQVTLPSTRSPTSGCGATTSAASTATTRSSPSSRNLS